MNYYFKSNLFTTEYNKGFYGLNRVPPATVVLYDDNQGFCIGYFVDVCPIIPEISFYDNEQNALDDIAFYSVDDDNVWFGDRLDRRWG
jgi:hypothetical protein